MGYVRAWLGGGDWVGELVGSRSVSSSQVVMATFGRLHIPLCTYLHIPTVLLHMPFLIFQRSQSHAGVGVSSFLCTGSIVDHKYSNEKFRG